MKRNPKLHRLIRVGLALAICVTAGVVVMLNWPARQKQPSPSLWERPGLCRHRIGKKIQRFQDAHPPPGAGPYRQLRVTNAGQTALENLVVIFPEYAIEFGDVPPGGTTDYHVARYGVYRYAAYEVMYNGMCVKQNVDDWLGEEPIPGHSFTYKVQPNSNPSYPVDLLKVIRDD